MSVNDRGLLFPNDSNQYSHEFQVIKDLGIVTVSGLGNRDIVKLERIIGDPCDKTFVPFTTGCCQQCFGPCNSQIYVPVPGLYRLVFENKDDEHLSDPLWFENVEAFYEIVKSNMNLEKFIDQGDCMSCGNEVSVTENEDSVIIVVDGEATVIEKPTDPQVIECVEDGIEIDGELCPAATVTGIGTEGDPYVITDKNGNVATIVSDTDTFTTVSGDGSAGDPYVITDPDGNVATIVSDTDTDTFATVSGSGTDADPYVITDPDGNIATIVSNTNSSVTGTAGGVYTHTAGGVPTDIEAVNNNDDTISVLGLKASTQILDFDCTPEGFLEVTYLDANTGATSTKNFKPEQENAAKVDFTANFVLDAVSAQALLAAGNKVLLATMDIDVVCPSENLNAQLAMHVRGAGGAVDLDKLDAQFQYNFGFSTSPTLATGNRAMEGPVVFDMHGETVDEKPQRTAFHELPNLPVGTNTLYVWFEIVDITRWDAGSFEINQSTFIAKRGAMRCC